MGPPFWEHKRREASSLTFGLLGGVEPDGCGAAGGAGEGGRRLEPGGDGERTPGLSHQQGAQQVQLTESHSCPEGAKTSFYRHHERVRSGSVTGGALRVL